MKIEVKNYDIKHYSALVKNAEVFKKMKKVTVFAGAMFVLIAVLTILVTLSTRSVNGIMLTCLTIIFAMFMSLGYRLRKLDPVKGFKLFCSKNPNYGINVSFEEDDIVLDTHTDVSESHSSYKYVRVVSAEEKEGFFSVLIDGSGYIVFNESEIVEGTAEEFRALLRKKIGTKYKEK
ncbi:hypothetical protein [Ruminococcus flavefaciens]|uniref:YcxB-like protein n=1 Tax=Ruminococcus flavefaciens TaxID=1265 RepID=A0A1M7KCZ3_RUMFL|nr:hypothetical protein [Ruminococcus flavefaciens]SHM63120.1 hypothetical protein SAMN04487860_10852 [Ruminococcus flavefaciens]